MQLQNESQYRIKKIGQLNVEQSGLHWASFLQSLVVLCQTKCNLPFSSYPNLPHNPHHRVLHIYAHFKWASILVIS